MRRRIARSAALFALVVLAGGWPAAPLRLGFSRLYCASMSPLLSSVTFGQGGHARLEPYRELLARKPGDNVDADSTLALRVDGHAGELELGMSLRRDAYLPWLLACAAILAVPLPIRRKANCLLLATVAVLALSFAAIWLLLVWTLAQVPGVYDFGGTTRQLLDVAFHTLLAPPNNRLIVPLMIAAALAWLHHPRQATTSA